MVLWLQVGGSDKQYGRWYWLGVRYTVECIYPSLERPARSFRSLPEQSFMLSISPLEQVVVLALFWKAGECSVSIAVYIGTEAPK